jgi:hypothetical protein
MLRQNMVKSKRQSETRQLCRALQTSMIKSLTPTSRRWQMSWTIRQRLTRLLTHSVRIRRRAMRRWVTFGLRVRARPRVLQVGMTVSTWSSANAKKRRSRSNRLPRDRDTALPPQYACRGYSPY